MRKVSEKIIKKLQITQHNKCNLCKIKLDKRFYLDYKVPLSKKGSKDYDNLQLICPKCYDKSQKVEGYAYKTPTKQIVCTYCGRVILGFSKKQVDYMLMQHIVAKHPERVKIE